MLMPNFVLPDNLQSSTFPSDTAQQKYKPSEFPLASQRRNTGLWDPLPG
jgi:hypothetical protein